VTDLTELWQNLAADVTANINKQFANVGAKTTPMERKLQLRWYDSNQYNAFALELNDAIIQESNFEVMCEALRLARGVNPSESFLGQATPVDPDEESPCTLADLISRYVKPDCVVIVTTQALTVLISQDDGFIKEEEEHSINFPKRVGNLNGHPVYVDYYAHNRDSVLICSPGWVSFPEGAGMRTVPLDPLDHEPECLAGADTVFGLMSTMIPQVDPALIRTIEVKDVWYMG